MSKLAELFPGFDSRTVETSAGRIFARIGGEGPPVLLLHGYPQTNVMWHRVAPALAKKYKLVIPDLPGYGESEAPEASPDHSPYHKRAMAAAMIELMQKLGHQRFALVGHDRGGRVGYRLTLDHPDRVTRLAVLDIVPTHEMWHGLDAKRAMKIFHWTFLAQPYPLPEMLIGKASSEYLDWKISGWNGKADLSVFDPRALAHYRAFFSEAKRMHATCEDYRAGQTTDLAHDEADAAAGKKIACPLLALWGASGIPAGGMNPLEVWRRWGTKVEGQPIASGHFLAEENPEATLAALIPFLAQD
ncbi:MAG: alpha/beta hydrolase [Xanthobacteraceae bacterium]|nr:alpha/beta hydrolase [Xanthobacteraceae bacterium]